MAENKDAEPTSITYHYQKSNYFRVIHVDGAYGGLTPNGNIHAAFWNERGAIPKTTTREIVAGQPAKEMPTDVLGGMVREVEVDVIFDLNSALSFHAWLIDKLMLMKAQYGISDSEWQTLWDNTHATSSKKA